LRLRCKSDGGELFQFIKFAIENIHVHSDEDELLEN